VFILKDLSSLERCSRFEGVCENFDMTSVNAGKNLHLTGGRLLARNVMWNILGTAAPLLVALPVVPVLIRTLGTDRFGVLTLAWAVTGYASLFDLGVGRALTQVVAKKLGAGEEHEIPALVWTSLLLMLLLGVLGMAVVVAISPWLVHHALKIPVALQGETLNAFYLLGLSVPIVITSTALRGLLEAHQRFDLVTKLRIPIGVFTFAGPLLVLPFTRSVAAVVGVIVAGRFAALVAHFWVCLLVVPELRHRVAWHGPSAGPLLRFGGWLTVGSVFGPMMLYMDRFVIGAMVSATAVAYYATPYEVVTKLFYISGAISGVMFPAFSLSSVKDRDRSSMLYRRTMRYLLAVLLPLIVVLILGAKAGLTLWLGTSFAGNSYRVAQLLLVGTFALGMAAVPFVLIQGVGRPDIPPKLNLVEIPLYAAGLYWMILKYGVPGAAAAWMLRAIFDAVLLIFFAHRLQSRSSSVPLDTREVSLASTAN
jgi:O-antigen/teichoic acid export membrane protein